VVTSIAEELVNIGHDVYIATGFLNRQVRTHNGVNIIEFKVYGGFGNYYRGETKEYRKFILNFDCDVIINECVQTWTTDLILKDLKNLKPKKILHSHGFSLLSYRTKNPWAYIKSKFYYYSLHKFLKDYNHIFLLHDKTVETTYLNNYGIKSFSYLPNGINEQFLSNVGKIEKTNKYLLSISNYYPMKNQEYLLEAFYMSSTKYKLVLIGSSILKNYLKKLKILKSKFDEKYGYRSVDFLFNISREDTIHYLEGATLFLHSSKLEVFPMVIVESMAKGVPFVSTDVGNVKMLKGGYAINNVQEMAITIDRILDNEEDWNTKHKEAIEMCEKKLTWNKNRSR